MSHSIKLKNKLEAISNYKSQGKYLHAIQVAEQLFHENPANTEVLLELAELYDLSGSQQSVLQLLAKYTEENPNDTDLKLFYGQYLFKHKMWEEAIQIFSLLVPEEKPISLFFLGHSYFMVQDYEMARISFLSFISLDVDRELSFEAHIYLAKIEIETKDYEQALYYAKQSEIFFNSHWELFFIYAKCYYFLGMNTHAVVSIEKSIKLNPRASELYELAGRIYLSTGDFLKAEDYFKKCLDSSVNISADVYLLLGNVCVQSKKLELAASYYESALKLDPKNEEAQKAMKKILKNNISISHDG